MTTSFTTTEDFGDEAEGFGPESDYPEVFGITFTPKVTGITIGVAGFIVAAFLGWTQLRPVADELSTLRADKATKETQLNQLSESDLQQQIALKEGELQRTENLKAQVEGLFAQERTLETVLLDLNQFVRASNVTMTSYTPSGDKAVVSDDSFGQVAINNIQVKSYNLNLEGSFSSLISFVQDLERLQPFLVVQNFNATVSTPQQYLLENGEVFPFGSPELSTTITVSALFSDVQEITPPAEEGTEETPEETTE
ncbi:type II and III secretion system protein [Cyanobacterium stanieri LEGE 03274]|uniref:Type II and III secretion system protein n=1 Tax=Cyanobacterium stanieri LEGE 03274 TaxID=1828756 RepID=A0ABR9V5E0_9CHRO|nr:type II and III secretion system protein [Cyanobacterium stanieri]MBE9223110.1 type II and III secretion system protein [Cyanobacterium stanieri LEGE 03274]